MANVKSKSELNYILRRIDRSLKWSFTYDSGCDASQNYKTSPFTIYLESGVTGEQKEIYSGRTGKDVQEVIDQKIQLYTGWVKEFIAKDQPNNQI